MTNRVSDSNSFCIFCQNPLDMVRTREYTNSGFRYIIEEKSITKGGEQHDNDRKNGTEQTMQ